jgi:hypothetical protein
MVELSRQGLFVKIERRKGVRHSLLLMRGLRYEGVLGHLEKGTSSVPIPSCKMQAINASAQPALPTPGVSPVSRIAVVFGLVPLAAALILWLAGEAGWALLILSTPLLLVVLLLLVYGVLALVSFGWGALHRPKLLTGRDAESAPTIDDDRRGPRAA